MSAVAFGTNILRPWRESDATEMQYTFPTRQAGISNTRHHCTAEIPRVLPGLGISKPLPLTNGIVINTVVGYAFAVQLCIRVPSVFGRNLQCQPVRGVNARKECHGSASSGATA
jgi:hypothetical protein